MPELPEVETTTKGLQKEIVGLKIIDVWTDLNTKDKRKRDTIADPKYFPIFKKEIKNAKILSVERVAKNILINLSNKKTILVHLKMTGNLFYGRYKPKDRFIHAIFELSNKKQLAFKDVRKFGKIVLLDTKTAHNTKHLNNLGPDALDKNLDLPHFCERLQKKPNGKIKTVLMNQSILAGIGNIYSDEILWYSGIHPERRVSEIEKVEFKKMFKAMKETLTKGVKLGGDSTSDYLNIYGLPGKFQLHHEAYRRTKEKCRRSRVSPRGRINECKGVIIRKVINGRSGHFCPIHQI